MQLDPRTSIFSFSFRPLTERFYTMARSRHYGVFSFLGDAFMTVITSGLWLIWVFVRELHYR